MKLLLIDYIYFFWGGVLFFGHATQHVGSEFPNQGSNPCPLRWKCRVLTTEPPEYSPQLTIQSLLNSDIIFYYSLGKFPWFNKIFGTCWNHFFLGILSNIIIYWMTYPNLNRIIFELIFFTPLIILLIGHTQKCSTSETGNAFSLLIRPQFSDFTIDLFNFIRFHSQIFLLSCLLATASFFILYFSDSSLLNFSFLDTILENVSIQKSQLGCHMSGHWTNSWVFSFLSLLIIGEKQLCHLAIVTVTSSSHSSLISQLLIYFLSRENTVHQRDSSSVFKERIHTKTRWSF